MKLEEFSKVATLSYILLYFLLFGFKECLYYLNEQDFHTLFTTTNYTQNNNCIKIKNYLV